MSRFTITVKGTKLAIEKISKQLYKIIEVVKVLEKVDEELILKEIALIKVTTKDPQNRRSVEDISRLAKAEVIAIDKEFLVIEKSGTEKEIDSLYILLRPFGIKEYVRSGRIALLK